MSPYGPNHVGGGTEGRIVEHGQIFFDRPTGCFWWQAPLTLDPFLPVGIRLDQTGIDREGLPTNQALANAAP